MKLIFLTFSLAFISFRTEAQDWLDWYAQYDFKIENSNKGSYRFDSLAIMINEPFESRMLQNAYLHFNDSSEVYKLRLSYGCISCGWSYSKTPSTIYLRIYLTDFSKKESSIIIPIVFEKLTEPIIHLNFKTIDIKDFVSFHKTRFEGIRVSKDGIFEKYKKGEFEYPSTNKLITVKVDETE